MVHNICTLSGLMTKRCFTFSKQNRWFHVRSSGLFCFWGFTIPCRTDYGLTKQARFVFSGMGTYLTSWNLLFLYHIKLLQLPGAYHRSPGMSRGMSQIQEGDHQTLELLFRRFWCPVMDSQFRGFIHTCPMCSTNKSTWERFSQYHPSCGPIWP